MGTMEGGPIKEPSLEPEGMREQTIDAIKEGSAWPTQEGLNDPGIQKAFVERLSDMSDQELGAFADQLEQANEEVAQYYEHGKDWKTLGIKGHERMSKFLMGLSAFTALSGAAYAVFGDQSVASGIGALTAIGGGVWMSSNFNEKSAEGRAALARAQSSLESIQNIINKVETEETEEK